MTKTAEQPPALTIGTGSSRIVDRCQICDSEQLDPILFLGYLPPVNTMHAIGSRPGEEASYSAQWLKCPRCHLVQLGLIVDPQILFPPDYPYTSGTTKILRDNFAELERECQTISPFKPGQMIVDIGSNDGTLLENFQKRGYQVQGVEPTQAGELAKAKNIPTHTGFFTREIAARIKKDKGLAHWVTATNVFAHMEDIHTIVEGIKDMLSPEGVFISESHYVLPLVETLQYDTIYHEHLRYYSLTSLRYLLDKHGFKIIHAKRIPTHGGSIRVYATRSTLIPAQGSVAGILKEEESFLAKPQALEHFRENVTVSKLELMALLMDLKKKGAHIVGVGAPSRASTLINYVGLDDGILDYVTEVKGSRKVNKYIPGTLIPVVDEQRFFSEQPSHALLLSWHIAEELIPKLSALGFRGDFIVPLPHPHVVKNPRSS